jgi:Redoxin
MVMGGIRRYLFRSFFLFLTVPSFGQTTPIWQEIGKVSIQDSSGHAIHPPLPADKVLVAFVFLAPDCPLCQQYSRVLNELSASRKLVGFYGIISGKDISISSVRNFLATYPIAFPVCLDKSRKLAKLLHASVTPQVILLASDGSLLYSGLIDNWVIDLGKQRSKATDFYLKDAIDLSLAGKKPAVSETRPIGCFINDY